MIEENSVLYYSLFPTEIHFDKYDAPPLKLYKWCWAEYQNKINKDRDNYEFIEPHDAESGVCKIMEELQYYHSPEKLAEFAQIWQELQSASFEYAIFLPHEVIVGEPSPNVKNMCWTTNVNITYHINGRYVGHRSLLEPMRYGYQSMFD